MLFTAKALRTTAVLFLMGLTASPTRAAEGWDADPVWHDGLVERAVYDASRIVYGKPRAYQMIAFTNKEQHDRRTLTKAQAGNADTVEVWKHNQVEVIPTPNYDYKYTTTSHYTVEGLELTRLDCSSQEFCGTSFKQYLHAPGQDTIDYWSFSYMPQAGRASATIRTTPQTPDYAVDALPLLLRGYDFAQKPQMPVMLLPGQKSKLATPAQPVEGVIRFAGEDDDGYKLEVLSKGELLGTYWMAKDRLHIMTRYQSADGQQTYRLREVTRTDFWTIRTP
jgi:hypothetical protein